MEASPTPIINYFSGFKQNLIPLYQRPYSWRKKQWGTLWEDIATFHRTPEPDPKSTHFMGAVVTMPARSVPVGVSKYLVIDGQQRLTTIAVLLCAIRDSLSSQHETLHRRIQSYFLTNDGYDGLDRLKLLPTQSDRDAYAPLIDGSDRLPDSQFRKAYLYYRRLLRGRDGDDKPVDPAKILAIVESRLMAVMINLGDSDDPNLIFESLNFKGAPLEQADLVRNYFLMKFPVAEQPDMYTRIWLPMQSGLGAALTDFMRHYMGAEGNEVLKGDVYAAIKRLVGESGPAAVRLLMSRMERLAALYSRIATLATEPDAALGKFFGLFHRLDFGTAYPLILALYEDYTDGQFGAAEFASCLKVLDSYIIRRMVAGVPSNSLGGTFIALCKAKPETENPAAWLAAELASATGNRRWPTDGEFQERWAQRPLYPNRACQPILEQLEEHFGHREKVRLDGVTIEHVMPQTLSPEWERSLGEGAAEIHERLVHTIGNLTLTGYNPELSNLPFKEKKRILSDSHLELNAYFATLDAWGSEPIQKRGQDLFQVALRLWPRPASAQLGDPQTETRGEPANFHADCVRAAQQTLGSALSKLSQTRYEAAEGGTRLVCAVSAGHRENSDSTRFWFSLHPSQLDFLRGVSVSWICLGCGSAGSTLLIPTQTIEPLLDKISVTSAGDRHYWHVVIQRRADRFVLRLRSEPDGPDLTPFLIPGAAAAAR
jgi:uncharacterized protein with ParB-like and HNH nuclease domain